MYVSRENKNRIWMKYTHKDVYGSIPHNNQDMETTQMLIKGWMDLKKKIRGTGVPWGLSGLRIWHCHCCSSGYNCGTGSVLDLGNSACCWHGQEKKKKKKKMWFNIHTMECYSDIKKEEILPFATIWMALQHIMISKKNQTEKDKYGMNDIAYMWNLKRSNM